MAKTREQMIDKMASKMKPMALKLGGEEKQKEVSDKFANLKAKGEKDNA